MSDAPTRALPVEDGAQPLAALIARVEAATGPDREIDAALYNAFPQFGVTFAARSAYRRAEADDGWRKSDGADWQYDLDRYTASLDAALALVERVLPGWGRELFETASGEWGAHFRAPHETDTQYAPRPAPALILALLRVLQAQPDRHDARDGASHNNSDG